MAPRATRAASEIADVVEANGAQPREGGAFPSQVGDVAGFSWRNLSFLGAQGVICMRITLQLWALHVCPKAVADSCQKTVLSRFFPRELGGAERGGGGGIYSRGD